MRPPLAATHRRESRDTHQPRGEIVKELNCRDVGFDCEGVIHGESEEDVMAQAAVHARDVHGLGTIDDDTASAIRSQIHDAA
jgi:predicted small metal-binding protein